MKGNLQPTIAPCAIARDLLSRIGSSTRRLQRESSAVPNVHRTRNNLARMRAGLRLLRESLGDRTYRRCNTLLRDAGRRLNALRDAEVLVQTAARLRRPLDDTEMKGAMSRLIEGLTREHAAMSPRHATTRKSLHALQTILGGEKKISTLSGVISRERLVCAYKNCRKAFRRAQDSPPIRTCMSGASK